MRFVSFILDQKRTTSLLVRQTSSPSPPPTDPVLKNSSHRQFILINYAVSRWSSGSRGRATSAREVIEVAGSNHAIGVILNLAWGPNNFSPSMIWSWRTRSNSQTGLGDRVTPPRGICILFLLSFLFFFLILMIFIFFFPFSLFVLSSYPLWYFY